MHKFIKILVLSILCFMFFLPAFCQSGNEPPEMAEGMRQSGKIYVVIAVILTILFGLIFYIIRLDKKITRLEKENG